MRIRKSKTVQLVLCQYRKYIVKVLSDTIEPVLLDPIDVHLQDLSPSTIVGALGDFNSDRYIDLCFIESQKNIKWYLWDPKEYKYYESEATIYIDDDSKIINIIPADYNIDGYLDIAIITLLEKTNKYKIHIVYGNGITFNKDTVNIIELEDAIDQPTILDINSDMQIDFLYPTSNGIYGLLYNLNEYIKTDISKDILNDSDTIKDHSSLQYKPNGIYTVDIDGDCYKDLILITYDKNDTTNNTVMLEIWLNNHINYIYHSTTKLLQGYTNIVLGDFNTDGSIDIAIPYCYPKDTCEDINEIMIYYNVQKPICQGLDFGTQINSNCKLLDNICDKDINWTFPFINTNIQGYTCTIKLPKNIRLATYEVINKLSIPLYSNNIPLTTKLPIQLADLNGDTYIDMIIPIIDIDTKQLYIAILFSIKCTIPECTQLATDNNLRTFIFELNNNNKTILLPDSYITALIDPDNNGLFHILTQQKGITKLIPINPNILKTRSRHITHIPSNGACSLLCRDITKYSSLFPNKPLGVSYPSVTTKFTFITTDGERRVQHGLFFPNTAYMSLNNPHQLQYTDTINDFIEIYAIGYTTKTNDTIHLWRSIVPNTQVVVYPYQYESDTWILDMYLSKPEKSLVIYSWVILLFITFISLFILYVHHLRNNRRSTNRNFIF